MPEMQPKEWLKWIFSSQNFDEIRENYNQWADRYETDVGKVSDIHKIYPLTLHGETWSAIQLTTAASLCAVLDLYLNGQISQRGFLKQEQIGLDAFLANRFGGYYNPV